MEAVLGTFHPKALDGRVALVTGSASGIGRAVAVRFTEAGAAVVAADIQHQAPGPRLHPVLADLSQVEGAQAVVSATEERFGGLDVIVHCAGIGGGGAVEAIDIDYWNRVLTTNLTSLYLIAAQALPMLRARRGGAIIAISSLAAFRSPPGMPSHAYAASKGGVASLVTQMAVTYGADHIRVNAVCPGFIDTAMTAALVPGAREQVGRGGDIPLGRVGEPDDVAAAALFLASDAAAYITGVCLTVDGGSAVVSGWDRWLPAV